MKYCVCPDAATTAGPDTITHDPADRPVEPGLVEHHAQVVGRRLGVLQGAARPHVQVDDDVVPVRERPPTRAASSRARAWKSGLGRVRRDDVDPAPVERVVGDDDAALAGVERR